MVDPMMTDPSQSPSSQSPPIRSWTPGANYLRLDEDVRVTSYNALAAVTLTVRARVLGPGGRVSESQDLHTPNTDRSAVSTVVRTDEGWLLGGEVFVSSAAPLVGQTFVVVEIVRGEATAAIALEMIAAGYVTAKQPLRFPLFQIPSSLDGGGALRLIQGSNPVLGGEINEVVPTGAVWDLVQFSALLTTSAVAGNRTPKLNLRNGAIQYQLTPGGQPQAASLAVRHQWMQGVPVNTTITDGTATNPLAVHSRLRSGTSILSLTGGIDGGDAWTSIAYVVREWIEG